MDVDPPLAMPVKPPEVGSPSPADFLLDLTFVIFVYELVFFMFCYLKLKKK